MSKIPRLLQSASPWVLGLGVLSAGLMGGYFVTSVQALRGMTTSELSDDLGFSVASVVFLGLKFLILTLGVGFEIVCRIAKARGRDEFGDGVSAYLEKLWARVNVFVVMMIVGILLLGYSLFTELWNPGLYLGPYRSYVPQGARIATYGISLLMLVAGAVWLWLSGRDSEYDGED